MRKDPVTEAMREAVFLRDAMATAVKGVFPTPICVAPLVDPSQSGKCWGRSTLDHVHGKNEMGVGKPRAKSDLAHLVTLCEGHTETGRRAGYQWNTAHRPGLRLYLKKANEPQGHLGPGVVS